MPLPHAEKGHTAMAGMKNVQIRREDNRLIIEVDLGIDLGPSTSGKTNLIATTSGNRKVPPGRREDKDKDDGIRVGVTVYSVPEERRYPNS